ncbi:MAG: DNA polymerase II large subunit [Candidatus Nanohaloarchaea archaeon]
MDEYFERLEQKTGRAYEVAEEARSQSKDPEERVDIPIATDLAEKASSLVIAAKFPELEDQGVAKRIRGLENEYGKNDERVAFSIAGEIAEGDFHEFDEKERACEAGVRVGVSYLTGGITTAPLEGIGDVRIRQNSDGSEYLAVYYSGPIRSAGGTASAMSVLLADYVRKKVGLVRFKASENVIKRYSTEVEDYYNRVTAKQYNPEREETEMIAENVPVEVTGSPTEQLDVSNHKDLDRVETNRIRSGMCLVYLDGLPLKASKIKKRIESWGEDFGLEHWMWIEDYLELQEEIHSSEEEDNSSSEYKASDKYLDSLTAGRPVFSHPGKKGGFRLRYGHSRTNGLAAVSFHPATMEITERFIAIGTQLKLEYPGKATVATCCDSIHPPVVRLENGEVRRIESRQEARKVEDRVDEILFLGDMLVTYGEFVENGKKLLPSPYVDEWWEKELERALEKNEVKLGRDFSDRSPTPEEAFKISETLDIPLHPEWTYHWRETTVERFRALYQSLDEGSLEGEKTRKALEDVLIEHCQEQGELKIGEQDRKVLERLLKPEEDNSSELNSIDDSSEIPGFIDKVSGIEVREQAPHYIGARMGRPEKAERRTIKGKPQLLFPCGKDEGGRMRNLSASYQRGEINEAIIHNKCPDCESYSYFSYCQECGSSAEPLWFCMNCGEEYLEEAEKCGNCGEERIERYRWTDIDVQELCDVAMENLAIGEMPELLKSVRAMSGKHKHVEPIEKGLLRQKHDLYVNKDGTVRYDATDLPMTHFKPAEIGVSVEKLKELGYRQDVEGEPLESEDQVLQMKPQDIVIPDTQKTLPASEYLVRVANFIDELLEDFYGLEPYYSVEEKRDLIGKLVIGLAPHTSGGTVGRIIGFTEAKGIYSHPYWHAAKRRNCLPGDEEVRLADGSSKELRKIFDDAEEGREADFMGTVEREIDLEVLSEKEGEIEGKNLAKVYRAPAQEFKLIFTTESGRRIEVFPDHRLRTSEGIKKARSVEEGDKLLQPVELSVEVEDMQGLKLTEFLDIPDLVVRGNVEDFDMMLSELGGLKQASDKLGISKKTLGNYRYTDSLPVDIFDKLSDLTAKGYDIGKEARIAAKRDTVELKNCVKVNNSLMELIGFYLAEGYTRKSEKKGEEFYQVCFAFGEKELKQRIENAIRQVFDVEPSNGDHVLTVSSRIVYEFFQEINAGDGAHSKKVPEFVKSLPTEKVKHLVSAYFAGDGSVEKGKLHVNATSVSRALLRDIDFLLKRFGIFARYSKYEREPGGVLLEKYGERYEGETFVSHKLHIRSSHAVRFGKKIGFAIERKQEVLEQDYEMVGEPRIETENEILYDPVESKEIEEADERFMYDLEVTETHNFVIGNSLITNNCDGDEDAILLLMDGLLNFSRDFLPDMTGARSVTKDTRIVVRRNGEMEAPRADELVDSIMQEGYEVRDDGFEVSREFEDEIETVTFDESGEVEFQDVSALIRHENDGNVFTVKTSRGEISVTGDHSVFVTRGDEIEAKPVRQLKEGECVIVPSNTEIEADGLEEKVDLFELLPDSECYVKVPEEELKEIGPEIKERETEELRRCYGTNNIYRYRKGKRDAPLEFYREVGVVPSCKVRLRANTEPIERFIDNSRELYRLLGYLLSEGDLQRGRIYNSDPEIIEEIQYCIEDLTGVEPPTHEDEREERKTCYWVDTPATLMRALEELGLERNSFDDKKIPSFVFGAATDRLEAFIEAYRSGDGSVYEDKGFSKLYTKSGEMASQLSLLLRKLGYKSSTRKAGDTWEILYSEWNDKDPYWPLWELRDEVRSSLKKQGYSYEERKTYLSNDRKNQRMKTASKGRVKRLHEEGVEELENVVQGEISVERVVEIEKVDYGDDYVYDLEVPGKQNFLCGPHPIFAHNTMDAPLILSTVLNADEIDDEAWMIETVEEYPVEFYEETQEYRKPWELNTDIEIGEDIVHSDNPFRHSYTHDTETVENAPVQSEYVTLDEMSEKTSAQLGLGEKLKAVDENKVAELLLNKHFIPDIKGNLRSFSSQEMRCVDCNEKFRRVPLTNQTIAPTGKTTAECPECGGSVLLTISEGTIKKYMQPSKDIIESYEISPYVRQQILILNKTLKSLFGKQDRQSGLKQFTA